MSSAPPPRRSAWVIASTSHSRTLSRQTSAARVSAGSRPSETSRMARWVIALSRNSAASNQAASLMLSRPRRMNSAASAATSRVRKSSGEITEGDTGFSAEDDACADTDLFAENAQPPTNMAAIRLNANGAATRSIATPLAFRSLLKIKVLRIIVPHVGFLEFRVVKVNLFILIIAFFFDLFAFVIEGFQIIEVIVFGTPSEMPDRIRFLVADS